MSLLKLFKKKEHTAQVKTQQANASLYPDRILVATEEKTVVGYSITTPNITKLPADATAESIGQTIRKHLSLSKTDVPAPSDFKAMYQDFLNKAGFKNAKAHHKNARHLSIYQKGQAINITPTINGGATGKERGFLGSKDMPSIEVNESLSDKELGEQIKEAWLKCSDNSV
jgi:CDI immunity protein